MATCEEVIQRKLDEYNALTKAAHATKNYDDVPYVRTVVTELILAVARRIDDLDDVLKHVLDELAKK